MRISGLIMVGLLAVALSACSGARSHKVQALQKKDKNLSCREIKLEINEAEFYRKTADNNKQPGVKSLLMPLGYISTYVDADDAASAASARIDYLNRVYEILNCDAEPQAMQVQQGQPAMNAPMTAPVGAVPMQPMMVPAQPSMVPMQRFYYQQPMMQQPMMGGMASPVSYSAYW